MLEPATRENSTSDRVWVGKQPIPPQALEGTGHVVLDDVPARLREAREYLAPVAADLRGRGVRVTTEARHGDPVKELVAAARDAGADLIAMTTHGRSGVGRLLFGSVAEAVLRQANVPVLMMRLTGPPVPSAEVA